MRALIFFSIANLFLTAQTAASYPLDSFDETGIRRLEGYFYSLPTASGRQMIRAGALLSVSELELSNPAVSFPPPRDSYLQQGLTQIVSRYGSGINISLIDYSQPGSPAYAGINDGNPFVPGSVGKVMVGVALFDALARMYPDSTSNREKVLRDHMITADKIIENDSHVVPFWSDATRTVFHRPLELGDRANLWSYLDFMMSPSSNAAGSIVMREVLLMNHLGQRYMSTSGGADLLQRLSAGELSSLMQRSFIAPMRRLGLDGLFQASFFTKAGKAMFPSMGSSASTRDLAHLLLLIEQGKVVDKFSSLELKRILYLTQARERYVGSPALDDAAVYFKAGSLYKCGGPCVKYEGTIQNVLNGISIIEYPVAAPKNRYIVALSTNIPRRNSEQLHRALAGEVHSLVLSRSGKGHFHGQYLSSVQEGRP